MKKKLRCMKRGKRLRREESDSSTSRADAVEGGRIDKKVKNFSGSAGSDITASGCVKAV